MYLLRMLQRKGLPVASIQMVFSAIILCRVIYALSAWGGFISAHDKSRVDKLLKRAEMYNYSSKLLTFDSLLEKADLVLFRKAQNTEHCLHLILPTVRQTAASLRDRGHRTLFLPANTNFLKSHL